MIDTRRKISRVLYGILCMAIGGGCTAIDKLPAGAQLQSSTFGLRFAPQSLDGSPLVLGSHSVIITTAQPNDSGPNLNRFEGTAPGVHLKSTVASGPVGEQLREMGGPEAVRALISPATVLPVIELPRSDVRGPDAAGQLRYVPPQPTAAAAERDGFPPFDNAQK